MCRAAAARQQVAAECADCCYEPQYAVGVVVFQHNVARYECSSTDEDTAGLLNGSEQCGERSGAYADTEHGAFGIERQCELLLEQRFTSWRIELLE